MVSRRVGYGLPCCFALVQFCAMIFGFYLENFGMYLAVAATAYLVGVGIVGCTIDKLGCDGDEFDRSTRNTVLLIAILSCWTWVLFGIVVMARVPDGYFDQRPELWLMGVALIAIEAVTSYLLVFPLCILCPTAADPE